MIKQIRGDTFFKVLTFPIGELPSAIPVGYWVGWEVKSQVRRMRDGELLSDCVCTWADPMTTTTLAVEAPNASDWMVGPAKWDVQFTRTSDGATVSTSLDVIDIIADSTL